MPRILALIAIVVGAAIALAAHPHVPAGGRDARTEVVVRLAAPPLARGGSARGVDAAQRAFGRALAAAVPGARVRWRYRLVLDGVAVDLPGRDVGRLQRLPGVREVFPSVSYPVAAGPAGDQIGAPALWAPGLSNAGAGEKIAIVDGGLDQRHPFLDPAGYAMPPGFPKGQLAFTTAKVIVARTFPAPGQTGAALLPYDPNASSSAHGTHVAGIAAGDAGAHANGAVVSGVAPRAYIGNYRALTVPTDSGSGEDGNAPELVAAIEAAVADGMDVINLSLGEPEIEPSRDVVALALDGAAAAGVVPVAAAGNDYATFGPGSLFSPGSSAGAISVAAVTTADGGSTPNVLADFSSEGPTPLSLRLKPDVSAPGVDILSSLPDGWGRLSGTSMATPHVSGGVALLLQRHPDWTPEQVKAALVETADPVWRDRAHAVRATPDAAGGGIVDLPRADHPLVFASPTSISLGFLHPGQTASRQVGLSDAGGGAGSWSATTDVLEAPAGATVSVPAAVTVPGALSLVATVQPATAEGDVSGYVTLTKDAETRRIPFWLRVTTPRLEGERATPLSRPGLHLGDTRGRPSLVTTYRYPQLEPGSGVATVLAGPEQVFRVTLRRPVANFGVAIVSRGPGVRVVPRVVAAGDENRLTGYAGLPLVINPYLAELGNPVLAAGAIRPQAGSYDVVFDSATPAGAGSFTFRFWVGDVTPPSLRLVTRTVRRGRPIVLAVSDRGSGVDAASVAARVGGVTRTAVVRAGRIMVATGALAPGRHRLRIQVSDYQETRNMENVGPILPNTRRLAATVTVRG